MQSGKWGIDRREGKQSLSCVMWFLNLSMHQNHMENLSKQFARPTPRESSIVGLKLDLRIYISKMFPVDIDADGLWTTFAVI